MALNQRKPAAAPAPAAGGLRRTAPAAAAPKAAAPAPKPSPAPAPKQETLQSMKRVLTTFANGQIVRGTDDEQELMVAAFDGPVSHVAVNLGIGRDYGTAKAGVMVSVPCYPGEEAAAAEYALAECEKALALAVEKADSLQPAQTADADLTGGEEGSLDGETEEGQAEEGTEEGQAEGGELTPDELASYDRAELDAVAEANSEYVPDWNNKKKFPANNKGTEALRAALMESIFPEGGEAEAEVEPEPEPEEEVAEDETAEGEEAAPYTREELSAAGVTEDDLKNVLTGYNIKYPTDKDPKIRKKKAVDLILKAQEA